MASRAFIVWTLRRTGGTSFANLLGELTQQKVEHEPFNWNRTFGAVTKRFHELRKLPPPERSVNIESDLAGIFDLRVSMKHCVELLHERFNGLLARTLAGRSDYSHFILRRRDNAARLLSLELAAQTGAWGKHDANGRYAQLRAGEITLKPVDAEALLKHQRLCDVRMNSLMDDLHANGIVPVEIWFEDLFQSTDDASAGILDDASTSLGLSPQVWRSNSEAARLLHRMAQGSKNLYGFFPNYDDALQRLNSPIAQDVVASGPSRSQRV